jgi:branched-chain amino acid aminotransferase
MLSPGFGRVFTEHVVSVRWSRDRGWHDARLDPFGDIALSPAAVGLHYGQIVFEGLKAYGQPDGGVAVFRPDAAARRMRASARRLAMPEPPESLFLDAITELVAADRRWVPAERGRSLYLRPLLLATEADLGLRPSDEYLFLLMAFVTDTFFGDRIEPVSVWVSDEYVRAAPGGTGAAKCPGNYAGSLLPAQEARERGCDQVVWLDAVERRWVEELGGMNLFFVYGPPEAARLVTPPLGGTILPGVTRDALITLGRSLGHRVVDERLAVDEWRDDCVSGSMRETFACGTGAVITPVGQVRSKAGDWQVGDGEPGVVTLRLREALVDLQHGMAPDHEGWMFPVR